MSSLQNWPDLAGRLTEDGHQLPVRVYFEDTDFSGLVYHASYLRFMERGRSDFLRLLGIHHHDLHDGKQDGRSLAFVVRHMDIDFLLSARIDDLIIVNSRIKIISGARMILDQSITLDGVLIIAASVTIALVDRSGKPRRFPQELLERLSNDQFSEKIREN